MIEGSGLLSMLRETDLLILENVATKVTFKRGDVLYEPGENVDNCYFPTAEALASYLVPMEGTVAVETLLIGREGALGGVVGNGKLPSYARAAVINGGDFIRISLPDLRAARKESVAIASLLDRYSDCVMAQVFQSIACNATHSIEQRAAKWLITAVERTGQNNVTMTQEELASMMGIGRSYASRVIQRLKGDKLVNTRRGGIIVLEPEDLKSRACSCNDLVRRHFQQVMKGLYSG